MKWKTFQIIFVVFVVGIVSDVITTVIGTLTQPGWEQNSFVVWIFSTFGPLSWPFIILFFGLLLFSYYRFSRYTFRYSYHTTLSVVVLILITLVRWFIVTVDLFGLIHG